MVTRVYWEGKHIGLVCHVHAHFQHQQMGSQHRLVTAAELSGTESHTHCECKLQRVPKEPHQSAAAVHLSQPGYCGTDKLCSVVVVFTAHLSAVSAA